MKKLICCFAVASLLALGGSAIAELCTIEAAPAATLLLPYFQVDLDNDAGVNTIFSINNASASAALTHVVVWSNMSVEVLDFNVYLTGYDMQTINLGLALKDGLLPITGNGEPESPVGPFSDPDGNGYPGCDELGFPYDNTDGGDASCGELGCVRLADVQEILRGNESTYIYPGDCAALPTAGGAIADGYVTVDLVNDCTLQTPCGQGWSNPDQGPYFGDGGLGLYDNILWGDYFYINGGENFAQGDNLVHIQAANSTPEIAQLSNGSFYNRCDWSAAPYADYRESLGTTFAAHYYRNAQFSGGTHLQVWRDSTYDGSPFTCGGAPGWYPIGQSQVVIFDAQENTEVPDICQISPCPPGNPEDLFAPREANVIDVDDIATFPSGWIYMNLNEQYGEGDYELRQNWVSQTHDAEGRFSVGYAAVVISDFCDSTSVELGESGDEFPAVWPAYSPYGPIVCAGEGGC
ncbi:MAG: hypothetical protein AB7G12_15500 [Thermoanaerobaculia bacterium]